MRQRELTSRHRSAQQPGWELSRRSLLKTSIVTGIAAGTPGLLSAVGAHAQTPVSAAMDELRIAMADIPPQLDPQTATWIVGGRIYSLLYDTLIRRDWSNGGAFVPGLATSWQREDDRTLVFTLRDDVLFHDGTPFTAADVKYTFDRTLQGDPNLDASGDFPIEEIEVLDDHRVRFITDGIDAAFELRLASHPASIIPAAYHQEIGYEGFQTQPVGTGPYRLTEYVPDSHLSFEVHEAYFDGVPVAQRVIVRDIPEAATRVAALLNDEVDLILDLPPDQIPTIEAAGGFKVETVSPLNVNLLIINGQQAPTDKKEVRQALSLVIDRGAIIDQLFGGEGVWPGSLQGELDQLYVERPPLPYDPERARELLAEADYAGEEIRYIVDTPSYYLLQREWSEVIVGMWSDVGFNVTINGLDVAERVELEGSDPTAAGSPHLVPSSTGVEVDLTLPTSYGNPESHRQRWYPDTGWDELNPLVEQAKATVDPGERAALYQQALDIMNDEALILVLFTINRPHALKETIQWSADPRGVIDLRPGKLVVN